MVIPPHWELEGETVVATLHVNTVVQLRGRDIEIDWARTSSPSIEDRKTLLSDEQALAELHNNLGTEALILGQLPQAFAEFRRALVLAPATQSGDSALSGQKSLSPLYACPPGDGETAVFHCHNAPAKSAGAA